MKNTIFALDDDSPKYKQIYERFKLFIEHGDLPEMNNYLPYVNWLIPCKSVAIRH